MPPNKLFAALPNLEVRSLPGSLAGLYRQPIQRDASATYRFDR